MVFLNHFFRGKRPRQRGAGRCVLLVALLFSMARTHVQAQGRGEDELKALFFVALARYAQWPTNSFPRTNEPLVIGLLGKVPFERRLNSLVSKEQVQGHSLQVKLFASVDEMQKCHMAFFGEMPPALLELSLAKLSGRPILTVSDQPRFLEAGGMIQLFINNENRVRLKISRAPVTQSDLILSPTLWRLAEKVALFVLDPVTLMATNCPRGWGAGLRSSLAEASMASRFLFVP